MTIASVSPAPDVASTAGAKPAPQRQNKTPQANENPVNQPVENTDQGNAAPPAANGAQAGSQVNVYA